HAASLSVAETPARSYNPLFIQGDSGLGKTHLLHAIGNYVKENFPGRQVRYVSTETFLNEFVDAIRTNTTTAFKRRYRETDVLLVTASPSLNRRPLNREAAEIVLADIVSSNEPRQITPQLILEATAETFGFTVEDLCGSSRRRPLVTARQIGMYVFREATEFSYPAIAKEFGGRDHTTVIHAVEKITALMKERRQIYDQVTMLIHRIKSGDTE